MEAIITGLIAAGASVFCTLLSAKATRDKVSRDLRERQIITDERLKSVEKKLDIHNGYAEKLGDINVSIAEIKTEIKNLKEK